MKNAEDSKAFTLNPLATLLNQVQILLTKQMLYFSQLNAQKNY